MKRTFSLLFVAALLMAAVPALAHHSVSAEFDVNKPVKFTGVIKKVDWTNPHIYTHVEVKEAGGKTTVYRVEGGPPNALFRQGWRKDTLKVGETVSVTGVKAKNPTSPNVGQATITTSDGKRVFGGAANRDGNGANAAAPAAQ
jgi:hypothetical protein